MFSRPYKAYNGVVSPEYARAYQICSKELEKNPQYKEVTTAMRNMMMGKPAPEGWESSNIHKRSAYWEKKLGEYSKGLEICLKREGAYGGTPKPVPIGDDLPLQSKTFTEIVSHPYFIPAIAVVVLIAVGVLVGKAIK